MTIFPLLKIDEERDSILPTRVSHPYARDALCLGPRFGAVVYQRHAHV